MFISNKKIKNTQFIFDEEARLIFYNCEFSSNVSMQNAVQEKYEKIEMLKAAKANLRADNSQIIHQILLDEDIAIKKYNDDMLEANKLLLTKKKRITNRPIGRR